MDLKEILKCYYKNEEHWEQLVVLYTNSRIVPFIGAGMSAPIYPLWKNAIINILNGNKEEREYIGHLLNENHYEEACEYVRHKIGKNGFINRVSEEFSINKIVNDSEENRKRVNSRYLPDVFNGPIFTTNFDKTIEFFYGNNFDNSYSLSNMNSAWASIYTAIRDYKHNIYKIHGDINDPNSWVFSKQEYEAVYGCKEFVEVIETVCQNMNFLFMGCSLTEGDRYVRLLSTVTKNLNSKGAKVGNFAFVSLPDDKGKTREQFNNEIEKKDRYLSGLGIIPIWYPCDRHEAINVLLSALKGNGVTTSVFVGDKTDKNKHFYLFSSDISVKDAFVDDCFDIYKFSGLDRSASSPINLQNIIKLVEENDLIHIEGDYGSGKTVLSTMIQWKLKENYKTLFFDAKNFFENTEIFTQLINFDDRCFVFVDGIDILIDIGLTLSDLSLFCERIDSIITHNRNITFVVTSRMYCHIDPKKGDNLISMYVALEMQRDELIVIRTKGFVDKNKYEKFFSNINPDVVNINNLNARTIKEWHKKSPSSCQVPLFAYAIGTYYYYNQKGNKGSENSLELLPDNKMIVYEKFVQKTIQGRFEEESLFGTINKGLYEKYETLLRNLAIRMIHEMRHNINYQEDVSLSQDFSKIEAYEVNIKVFSEEIQRLLQEFVIESKANGVLLSDAINNYFFNIKESASKHELTVRFSDLNVMSCFAAEYIYDVIIKIADCYDDNITKGEYDKIIKELGMVELQPQVIDFLICKIEMLDNKVLDSLLYNILKFIKIYNKEQMISEKVVRTVLLLYIVFIKFWGKTYKSTGIPNFFKTFYRLCMTAKALNINGKHVDGAHRYLAERYFMNCSFVEYQFKRLNYKFYNFSKSRIINSSFEQCNFLENDFFETRIKNSNFKLCTIKTKFQKTTIEGMVIIDNSILDDLVLDNISQNENGSILIFKGCTVIKLTIRNTDNRFLKLIFENCILSDLKIKNCKGLAVEIKECVVKNKISIDVNSNVYSNNTDFFDKSVKSLENLEEYDFRASSNVSFF